MALSAQSFCPPPAFLKQKNKPDAASCGAGRRKSRDLGPRRWGYSESSRLLKLSPESQAMSGAAAIAGVHEEEQCPYADELRPLHF